MRSPSEATSNSPVGSKYSNRYSPPAQFQDDVLYIGSGKIGRHTHCDSGISNVYGLNRLHFGGVELDVKVLKTFKNQKDSIDEEVRLIKHFSRNTKMRCLREQKFFGKQKMIIMT